MRRELNVRAIVESVVESNTGYEKAIKKLASAPCLSGFTSEDVSISGSTLSWLARYGVLKVVGKTKAFICIDEYEETYKKIDVNVYEIDCDIVALARAFEDRKKEYQVQKIEARVKILKEQLAQALADLEEIQ